MTARAPSTATNVPDNAVQLLGSRTKTQKRRERRLKMRFGRDYVPLHERVVTGLKQLIDEQFPVGDMSEATQACRSYWLSHVTDIQEELNADVYDVHSIVGDRWTSLPNGQVILEFDTRYIGYEDEQCWQPYENVQHLTLLADYISSRAS